MKSQRVNLSLKSCDTVVKASKIHYIEKPGSISAQIYTVPIIYVENSPTKFLALRRLERKFLLDWIKVNLSTKYLLG